MQEKNLEICVEKVKAMREKEITDSVVTCRILCSGYNPDCKDYKPIGKAVKNSKKDNGGELKGCYKTKYFKP